MTELENALAGARAALQQYVPEAEERSGHLDYTGPVDAIRPTNHSVGISDSFLHSGVTTNNRRQHDEPKMNHNMEMFQTPLRSPGRQEPASGSVDSINMPLEASPLSGNWEWDERAGRTNGNRFVDGMASLTSNSNDGGYLGEWIDASSVFNYSLLVTN